MRYIFSLLVTLLVSFSISAADCPEDKPFRDIKGNCYSCEDERTFIRYPKDIGVIEKDSTIQYKGNCLDICPNRIEYSDGWLDAEHYCALDTSENRTKAYIVKNAMSIVFNPFNWVNFFLIWYFLSHLLGWIFRKDKASVVKKIIDFITILPSLVLAFTLFLNNLIFTLISVFVIIIMKVQEKVKTDKHFWKSSWLFVLRILLVLLFLAAFVTIIMGF